MSETKRLKPRGIFAEMISSFFRHDCFNLAANLSFYSLLALIPLAMIMTSLAGFFLGSSETVTGQMMDGIMDVVPMVREIFVANLNSLMEQKSSLGIVGVIFLFFIATILLGSIEHAFDTVFQSVKRRNFFHSRLLGIALIFNISLIFFVPTMAEVLEGLLHRYGFSFPLTSLLSTKIFFLFIALISFVMTAVVIPNQKVYARYAIVGGVIFATGIGIAKYLFRWYMVLAFSRYNIIYGSLTAVVLLVLWIYYLAVVMLIASEAIAVLQARRIFHRRSSAS